MTPSDVQDIRLIHPHTAIVDEPWLDEGEGAQLIVVWPELLPRIFTRVLKVHRCDNLQVGDYIMFKKNCLLDYLMSDGRRVWAMDERAALCVLPFTEWK